MRDCAKGNPDIRANRYRPLEQRECEEFIEQNKREGDEREDREAEENAVRATLEVCREWALKEPRARKLVSVSEAREVASRLAERNKARSEESREDREKVKEDEIDAWFACDPSAMG